MPAWIQEIISEPVIISGYFNALILLILIITHLRNRSYYRGGYHYHSINASSTGTRYHDNPPFVWAIAYFGLLVYFLLTSLINHLNLTGRLFNFLVELSLLISLSAITYTLFDGDYHHKTGYDATIFLLIFCYIIAFVLLLFSINSKVIDALFAISVLVDSLFYVAFRVGKKRHHIITGLGLLFFGLAFIAKNMTGYLDVAGYSKFMPLAHNLLFTLAFIMMPWATYRLKKA